MKLIVRPVIRSSDPQGRRLQKHVMVDHLGSVIETSMNKTKEFETIENFSFDANDNKLITGLDKLIPNKLKGSEPMEVINNYALDDSWTVEQLKVILSADEITKQTYYEIIDGMSRNYYTSKRPYSKILPNSIFHYPSNNKADGNADDRTFLQKFKVTLVDGSNVFDDSTIEGRFSILLLQNHRKIASGKSTMNNNEHHFYIAEREEDIKEASSRNKLINLSVYELVKLQNETPSLSKHKVISILTDHNGQPLIAGEMTQHAVDGILNSYLKDNVNKHQFENIDKFIAATKLLKSKEGLEILEVKYAIQQALNSNVIYITDNKFVWGSKKLEPNVYTHNSLAKLEKFFISEFEKYEEESELSNYYGDLITELKAKGVKFK